MKRTERLRLGGLIATLALAISVALAVTLATTGGDGASLSDGAAQEAAVAEATPAPTATPAPGSSDPSGDPGEGITVHGYWTIDILDPDGTLVRHTEFENALFGVGNARIARVLARVSTWGPWGVSLQGLTGPFCGGSTFCSIVEPPFGATNDNLVVEYDDSGSVPGVRLTGSMTPTSANIIIAVMTFSELCDPTTTPEICGITAPSGSATITRTSFAAPDQIAVDAGQLVQVDVLITFE